MVKSIADETSLRRTIYEKAASKLNPGLRGERFNPSIPVAAHVHAFRYSAVRLATSP